MSLTAIIVDDEPLARELLAAILADFDDIEILAQCQNGVEAVDAVLNLSPDIMFLDIEMPGMTGLDVVRAIQSDIMPMVIFTTAYAQYAVEAFRVRALNYVLKPLDEKAIIDSVARAREALHPIGHSEASVPSKSRMLSVLNTVDTMKTGATLTLRDNDTLSVIETSDLDWAEADGDYVCLHMGDKTRLIRSTLKAVEAKLSGPDFQRIHRSTIINLNCIKDVILVAKGEAIVMTKAGHSLKVSRSYGAILRKKLSQTT